MRNLPKISSALVACWLFAVTVTSNFLTFSSGSITGSVFALGETSLQTIVSAPSTAFTVWEFYTLMEPGATPANTVSFTAAVNYPQITTEAVFPQVMSSKWQITSPVSTTVDVVYTLILASVTPVGSPGGNQDTTLTTSTTSTPPKDTTLITSTSSTPPPSKPPPTPTPTPSPHTPPPQPSTKPAAMPTTGVCGRVGQGAGGKCGD